MATNTLGEFSDGEDDFVMEIDENLWEWSDPEADNIIRNIDENEVLAEVNQTGRGEKRKSDDEESSSSESGEYYYNIESVKKHHSKKFGMTATDHTVRFNNVLAQVDLLESTQRTQAIFHHLIEDITWDMDKKDQVRFILRSEQLDTRISIPFLPVEQLTTERVFSQIERVIQSNQDFRLNDTVTIDIIHVVTPQGSGKSKVKRTTLNIREYLKKKKSIITINNDDNLCLARALAVSIARIEKDPRYKQIINSRGHIQLQRALDLHRAANVPLGPCGMDEVKLFQQYLISYQIIVVSGDHNGSIIYPHKPPPNPDEKQSIYLYFHANHFDVITSISGFLNRSYFCHRCHKSYSNTADHVCPAMCGSCRAFDCVLEGDGIVCNECDRLFKNQACYDRHKEPINGGGRSVCEVVRKCEKCGKVMDVRQIKDGHICGKKCRTCGLILNKEDTEHQCYIQQLEQEEDSSYNHLLFFDFESTQEHGITTLIYALFTTKRGKWHYFRGRTPLRSFANGCLHLNTRIASW